MTLQPLVRLARALPALLLAAAVVASCSGSSKKPTLGDKEPLPGVVKAMHRAASGHVEGTTRGPEGTGSAPLEGSFDGGLSGEGLVKTAFVRANGDKLPTEMRWVDKKLYFTRTAATVPSTEAVSVFTRPQSAKPWRALNLKSGIVLALPSAFSPVVVVDWLQRLEVPVKAHDGERVGDVETTRLTTTRPIGIGVWLGATVDLWVDKDELVVRVRITSPGGGAQYDVTDYGAAVDVSPPPADQIATRSELVTPEPNGPFTTVKSGTTSGVTWALQRAPGSNGTECWRWQATPPLAQPGLATPDTPQCAAPLPETSDDPSELVDVAVHGDATGSYDALAVLLPAGVKKLTLGFVGGKTEQLTPDRVVVWVGPPSPVKAYLGVTLADGTTMDCGAGAVASVGDLTDPKATADLGGAAWGCIPPA
jgi:hypothetical protein